MRRSVSLLWGLGTVVFFLVGCATSGERFPVRLSYQGEVPSLLQKGVLLKVVVFPMKDDRHETESVGRRIHFFGLVDTFESSDAVGERISQLLVASLRQRGWDARMAEPGLIPDEIIEEEATSLPDRVVSGRVQDLWANATSRFGYTEIRARLSLSVEIWNPKSGDRTILKVEDENAPKVVLFHPNFLEETLNEMITGSVNRILQ